MKNSYLIKGAIAEVYNTVDEPITSPFTAIVSFTGKKLGVYIEPLGMSIVVTCCICTCGQKKNNKKRTLRHPSNVKHAHSQGLLIFFYLILLCSSSYSRFTKHKDTDRRTRHARVVLMSHNGSASVLLPKKSISNAFSV